MSSLPFATFVGLALLISITFDLGIISFNIFSNVIIASSVTVVIINIVSTISIVSIIRIIIVSIFNSFINLLKRRTNKIIGRMMLSK